MLILKKLSIAGFKSFADPVELTFNEGMTGVVGPNGCGKSNVLESLKWVMGESRAKALRGEGFDDVIFSGTSLRPARGLAEVRLTFDNPHLDAPAPYTDQPEIEITRTVTRASGSSYRINGRPARARDVQLFLSEANTGASSPAFVTQGQVAALIAAKPEARREMIEEAAGISGLYIRRKEAESRLGAASGNLTRVQDIMTTLGNQIATLEVQAKDALLYKDLSTRIQVLEAAISHAEWQRLREGVKVSQAKLTETLKAKNEHEFNLTDLEEKLEAARTALETARQAEEENRASFAAADNERVRLTERLSSRGREEELVSGQLNGFDAQDALIHTQIKDAQENLDENAKLLAECEGKTEQFDEDLAKLRTNSDEAQAKRKEAEANLEAARKALVSAQAALDAGKIEKQKLTQRHEQVKADLDKAAAALREATSGDHAIVFQEIEKIDAELLALEEKQRQNVERETTHAMEEKSIREQSEALRPQKSAAEKALAALEAEYKLLQKAFDGMPTNTVLSQLHVTKGYDRAVAVVLGETAQAGLSANDAALYWGESKLEAPALPAATTALADYVQDAPQLKTLLAYVGVAASDAEAEKAANKLSAGQMIVTKDGALWRWDGLRVTADYVPSAAKTLADRQRADALAAQITKDATAIEQLFALERQLEDKQTQLRTLRGEINAEKQQWTQREQELSGRRRKLEQKKQEHELQLTSLRTRLASLDEEVARLQAQLAELPDMDAMDVDPTLTAAVETAAAARETLAEAEHAARAALTQRESEQRLAAQEKAQFVRTAERLERDIYNFKDALKSRADEKEALIDKLAAMREEQKELQAQIENLGTILENRSKALEAATVAATKQQEGLRDTESLLAAAQKTVRAAHEAWVEAGARVQQINTHLEELCADISARFGVEDPAELALSYPTPDGNASLWLTTRTALVKERDDMGAINMKAPEEYETSKGQYDALDKERTDLSQAIAELSGTIERINADARERLNYTVSNVNELFGPLFVKLFGGGQANLVWTKADDILNAGVEIMAQPPGKKLQTLSLLSGGEQALTAIALILAMVKTHPAPICVFDEIDAALDESNVDRVSQALTELAGETEARLIVVSHHRLMMSRMDRLYGVTMAERGVSKLVSVDLHKQPELFADDEGRRLTA